MINKPQSNDELITLGLLAKRLLTDDDFNNLFELVANDLSREWLASSQNEKETRESLYSTFDGMRAFAARLAQYVSVMDQVVARMNQDNETPYFDDNE